MAYQISDECIKCGACAEEGKNLAELTMQNLALLCGSGSLDEFEENL